MIFLWILIGLALVTILFVWLKTRKRYTLSGADRSHIEAHWQDMLRMEDPARRVMEADIILDQTLTAMGYTGTLGEKLKTVGPILPNQNSVWSAHKLRNRIAHEPSVRVSVQEAETALKAFEKAIRRFF